MTFDPAMSDYVVHLTGRRRSVDSDPLLAPLGTPEQRLSLILEVGFLMARPVARSNGASIVAVSDLSAAELDASFRVGLNARGCVEPWAVALDRRLVWGDGLRPVIYTARETADTLEQACEAVHGPGWGALVMSVELAGPWRHDWVHEREWRKCWPPGVSGQFLNITGSVRAVVVGRSGWAPAGGLASAIRHPVSRWWWTGAGLVMDGCIYPG